MGQEEFENVLGRTGQFHCAVASHVNDLTPSDGVRYCVAFRAASLSLEHAVASLLLLRNGLYPSGFTLMRMQYESLVRGIWLLYAANDLWIGKLSER